MAGKQAIPAFCRGTNEALLKAISEGGQFYPLQRIIWCWIKSGERQGQLAFVTPGLNDGDAPVVKYIGGSDASSCFQMVDSLPDIEDAQQDVLYIYNQSGYIYDGAEMTKIIGGEGGSGSSSELERPLTVSKSVGGISTGKTYVAGTSFETILRDMLNPVSYPALTAPSATITATGAKLLEKGATLNTTISVVFSRGSISPAYGTSGLRSGRAIDYSLNGGEAQTGNIFNIVVDENHTTYQVIVNYADGEQPKDSIGNDYSVPLSAGYVSSNTIIYDFTYAIWSNASDSTNITKMDLVKQSAKQRIINFGACSEANPETFDIPTEWGLSAIEVKNDLTGNYDLCTNEFISTQVSHEDAAGNTIDYTRYSCNLGYDMGAREIRIKWS